MKTKNTLVSTVCLLSVLLAGCAWGVVTDAQTGEPIQGAKVEIHDSQGGSEVTTTNEGGVYALDALRGDALPSSGPATFEVSVPGYETLVGSRDVLYDDNAQGTVDTQQFQLQPSSPAHASIEFTYVPPYGGFGDVEGLAHNVRPADFAVAVYIRVRGGWWTKPYWSTPLTPIRADGSWKCDVTTGGIDEQATEFVAFLVPAGYEPTLASGEAGLPSKVERDAIAKTTATRSP